MSNKNLMAKLRGLEGAVNVDQYDPMNFCLRTPSPSVNWAFANKGHGIPYGYSMLLYGPPKGGKSLICSALIGQMHQDDLDSIACVFNTEMRGEIQSRTGSLKSFGIDPERYICFDVNQPEQIFDRIEKDLASMIQEGLKIRLIIIDSLKGIQGRRALNATSVSQQQIGDQAATIQDGLLRILPVIRKYRIALILTTHIRAELDPVQQMKGNTTHPAAAFAAKHLCELFCNVEPNTSKTGKVSLAGDEFLDEGTKDFMDKALVTGHKIRFRVTGNSMGQEGRAAEFSLDYNKGIINQYEEVFVLARNLGIIERPNNVTYKYGELTYRGLQACLTAIRDNPDLYNELLTKIYQKDAEGLN